MATQQIRGVAPDLLERYEPVIGLEVHAQLKTASKIFCACSTRFGDPPNTNVCPVCLGLPVIEIVSEPDLRSPAEAYAYLTTLKQVLEYTEVSDCNMEEGSLRCDANVSVRRRGAEKFGTKTEVKNLNSFRYLQHALEYEIERHIGVLESGGQIEQETRLWNLAAGRTEPMRSKEFAHDYRYFPEPDLLPVRVSAAWKAEIERAMPELPGAK